MSSRSSERGNRTNIRPSVQIRQNRPNCEEKDAALYLTFWPILAFSIFMAVDEIIDTPTASFLEFPGWFVAPLIILKQCTHMFAVATLALSACDVFVEYVRKDNHMCKRSLFAEFNTFLALISFIGASFIHTFAFFVEEDPDASLAPYELLLCQLVPYCLIVIFAIGQCFYIWIPKSGSD